MGNISVNDTLKCAVGTKYVDKFNIDFFNTKDNPRLNSVNELLSCNRLMLNMKL